MKGNSGGLIWGNIPAFGWLEGLQKTATDFNQDSPVFDTKFEPETSRIRSRSVIPSNTTFGTCNNKFYKNTSCFVFFELKYEDERTLKICGMCIQFMHFVQTTRNNTKYCHPSCGKWAWGNFLLTFVVFQPKHRVVYVERHIDSLWDCFLWTVKARISETNLTL
jgi:hypothetical protein